MLERLSEGFARDELSMEEFEVRVDRAHSAASLDELATLLEDLAPEGEAALAIASPERLAARPSESAPRERLAVAILGSVERRTVGPLPARPVVLSVLGNVELDLRDIELPPGVTELHVRSVFGNVELTVPTHVCVRCRGTPILGSFAQLQRAAADPSGQAELRVTGVAIFGNVEVRARPSRALVPAAGGPRRAR